MDQMNISITDRLAAYVRKKVRTGRFNNASEVVREALRRMEEDEMRELRLAEPTVEDILSDLTSEQLDAIRRRVRRGIADLKAGNFETYEGNEGLKELAENIKKRGRQRLRQEARTA
jgi:antitoxin ParD1/3/4